MTIPDPNVQAPAAPERPAAAMPDPGQAKRWRVVALGAVACLVVGTAVAAARTPDPSDGPRPEVVDIAQIPRAQMAYEAFARKHRRAPSPKELTKAIARDRGPRITVIGPKERKPRALRLAGTPKAPTIELLDERGRVAMYGDSPVVVQVHAP